MNSFAVTMSVAAACMCGYFIPNVAGEAQKCYECKEGGVNDCGKAGPSTWTKDVDCAAAKKCYEVEIRVKGGARSLGIMRGCASATAEEKCSGAPVGTHEMIDGTCNYCQDKDNCNEKAFVDAGTAPGNGTDPGNGHPPPFKGSAVFCALLYSLVVARLFYITAT